LQVRGAPGVAVRLALVLIASGCGAAGEKDDVADLKAAMDALRPLHHKLGKPRPGDWLSVHREPGQTFDQYAASDPIRPVGERRVIYVQPLGEFTPSQRRIVELTREFLGLWFSVPSRILPDLPASAVPDEARRRHPSWGMEQVLTTYVLDKVLKPRLPADAAACLALTATDLWPGPGWNFVFGQASLRERVGVWSIYRNGDPDAGEDEFRLCLLRTLKTAAHETGHMFSMLHCTAYECCMCGSNHREESDRRPLWLCPECMAKVCWATGADPAARFRKLADFCKSNGLRAESAFYEKCLAVLAAEGKAQPPDAKDATGPPAP